MRCIYGQPFLLLKSLFFSCLDVNVIMHMLLSCHHLSREVLLRSMYVMFCHWLNFLEDFPWLLGNIIVIRLVGSRPVSFTNLRRVLKQAWTWPGATWLWISHNNLINSSSHAFFRFFFKLNNIIHMKKT